MNHFLWVHRLFLRRPFLSRLRVEAAVCSVRVLDSLRIKPQVHLLRNPDAAKSTSASPFSTQTPSFGQPSAVGGGFGGQTPASSMGTTPFSTGGFGDFAKPQGSSLFGGGGAGQASFGGPSNTSTSSPFGGSSGSMFGSQSQSQSPASNSSPFKTSMPAFGQTSGIGGASSGAGGQNQFARTQLAIVLHLEKHSGKI